MSPLPPLAIVIPAAGVGSRMQADKAKQYIKINNKTILEHTLTRFVELAYVQYIYVVVSPQDQWFAAMPLAQHEKVRKVIGGKERADSVLNGVNQAKLDGVDWLMVHDAARPCVCPEQVTELYQTCLDTDSAGILATQVRDTMKRAQSQSNAIASTVDRERLWHAQTPQCAKVEQLQMALQQQLQSSGQISTAITDEASALEMAGIAVNLVPGSVKNIKVTLPEDLELAEFYLAGMN